MKRKISKLVSKLVLTILLCAQFYLWVTPQLALVKAAPDTAPFVQNAVDDVARNSIVVWWCMHSEKLTGRLWMTEASTREEIVVPLVWSSYLPASDTSVYQAVLPVTTKGVFVVNRGVLDIDDKYSQEIANIPLILFIQPLHLYLPVVSR